MLPQNLIYPRINNTDTNTRATTRTTSTSTASNLGDMLLERNFRLSSIDPTRTLSHDTDSVLDVDETLFDDVLLETPQNSLVDKNFTTVMTVDPLISMSVGEEGGVDDEAQNDENGEHNYDEEAEGGSDKHNNNMIVHLEDCET